MFDSIEVCPVLDKGAGIQDQGCVRILSNAGMTLDLDTDAVLINEFLTHHTSSYYIFSCK